MYDFFKYFLTPALLTSIFLIFFNNRAEKRRILKQSLDDSLKHIQELISSAVEASAAYFCESGKNRTPKLEAEIWLRERELRELQADFITFSAEDYIETYKLVEDKFDEFIGEMTSGSFQQIRANPDIQHIRKIASIGAVLKRNLLRLKIDQQRAQLQADPLDKMLRFLGEDLGYSLRSRRRLPQDD